MKGVHKYESLGIDYKLKDMDSPSYESVQIACKILKAEKRD